MWLRNKAKHFHLKYVMPPLDGNSIKIRNVFRSFGVFYRTSHIRNIELSLSLID